MTIPDSVSIALALTLLGLVAAREIARVAAGRGGRLLARALGVLIVPLTGGFLAVIALRLIQTFR